MNAASSWLSILIAAGIALCVPQETPAASQDQPEKITSRIPREPVASSAIAFVGYSKRLQILEIEFLNGAIYRYVGVPRSVHHKLMASQSKAHYYHEHVRGNFRCFRVRKWQTQKASD